MLYSLPLAVLFALSVTPASAQPRTAQDFSGLASGRTVIVATDSGVETSGRLLRLSDEELTLKVGDRDQTFVRTQVAAIYERGDSIKNGALIGLMTGAALGAAAGTNTTCGGFWVGLRPCSFNEKVRFAMVGGAIFGSIASAIGIGIDAMIPGRHLLYEKPTDATTPAISIAPSLSRSRAGLSTRVSW
jgi:hypothetical protein